MATLHPFLLKTGYLWDLELILRFYPHFCQAPAYICDLLTPYEPEILQQGPINGSKIATCH